MTADANHPLPPPAPGASGVPARRAIALAIACLAARAPGRRGRD